MMNKEVIKKYKDVFDYWLDGGKVLFKDKMHTEWIQAHKNHEWRWSSNIYVQDDQYAEFRKALAEGKIVEKCYYRSPDCPMSWEIMQEDFRDMVQTYRIKPDEPKFKVDEWCVFSENHKG